MANGMKRIEWLDVAKGLGILFMIYGHNVLYINMAGVAETIRIWLYSFHMPLFFVLAGITYNQDKYSDLHMLIKNKIKTLLIPYLMFAVFINIYKACTLIQTYVRGQLSDVKLLIKSILGIVIQIRNSDYYGGIWFLPCIFIAFILLNLIIKISKGKKHISCAIGAACMLAEYLYSKYIDIKLPWGADAAFAAVFFMILGYELKDILYKLKQGRTTLLFGIVALLINIAFTYLNNRILSVGIDMSCNRYGNLIYFVVAALSGIAFIIAVSSCIHIEIIRKVGSKSIYYYGMHLIFVDCLTKLALHFYPGVGVGVAEFVISITFTLIIIAILSLGYGSYEKLYSTLIRRIN